MGAIRGRVWLNASQNLQLKRNQRAKYGYAEVVPPQSVEVSRDPHSAGRGVDGPRAQLPVEVFDSPTRRNLSPSTFPPPFGVPNGRDYSHDPAELQSVTAQSLRNS